MKRLILALAAVATVAGPMAAATSASAQPRDNNWDRNDRNDGGRDHRGGYDNRSGYDNRGGYERRDNDRRDDRRDDRRWDGRRDNGYYYSGRWNYGPPPQAYYGRPGFRPGYQAWQRGGYLPREYRSYAVYDYGRYRLRPPPRGYQWVRVNDDFILEALATGLIADVLLGAGRY